ncbi:Gfo/Idh/MocA family protein [Nocardiopsis xinjiangensis]|uniref:Gfo/Idh/MocA family protein n=1 Tax=Nocardiopsis xinjiangensis TaxID=124285 RepID=UPI000346144C|nr:Gfo/Idh/MocA family oxidoreductase [Nocardiopsis xinjiangensis]
MAKENPAPRWGVMGTGGRAHALARALGPHLTAVGSRSHGRARAFAHTWNLPTAHDNYADLAADPGVDVVHVATPHPWHHPHTLLALHAGKHVLVEAPLAMNASQTTHLLHTAHAAGCFLMEGSPPRHLPIHRLVHRIVAQGAIGQVSSVHAQYHLQIPYDPAHRHFDLEQGGGALLDAGIHPLRPTHWYLGELTVVGATRPLAPGQMVDTATTVLAHGAGGATATLSCASQTPSTQQALITGTTGQIQIQGLYRAEHAVLHRQGHAPQPLYRPAQNGAHPHQSQEVTRCLQQGRTQSPVMPWAHSRALAQTLDRVRDTATLLPDPAHLTSTPRT